MFSKKNEVYRGRNATIIDNLGCCDLADTLECGQAFRYEPIVKEDGYVEYMTVAYGRIIRVGQRKRGELIFYDEWNDEYEEIVKKYFCFDIDFEEIRKDIISRTDSDWLKKASEEAKGIVILSQDPWEALFSFIISQNNNIPRIRKIIRSICSQYGTNLSESGCLSACPLPTKNCVPGCAECNECGICYSFPTPNQVVENPDKLLPSHPGFRFKYLVDAARKVSDGSVNLDEIAEAKSYDYTVARLKEILGVGDKVASCVALFGFGNLEAFPIDVWMKRAIDEYFDGHLDPTTLGKYAGVAQQYIFHYIRNLQNENDK
ncbi:MAG: DNA-3-methyladenine glycosylase 2 family protein [Clostridia bacterium]|nr:DNA-3-methyladenine glycosylase 2 family protein [Clostridia bacterium]